MLPMNQTKQKFVELIRNRSEDNKSAILLMFDKGLISNCLSTLRQELDSFVRIIFLGRINDISERRRLMKQTLNNEKWIVLTSNNKSRVVTDRDMIERATELKGYVSYVYKFGCSFIHLSNFHNYRNINPFESLSYSQRLDIKIYLHQYHGFPMEKSLNVDNVAKLIPDVFSKISENMSFYLEEILNDQMILT